MIFREFLLVLLLVLLGANGVVIATVTSVAARSQAWLALKPPVYQLPKNHSLKV